MAARRKRTTTRPPADSGEGEGEGEGAPPDSMTDAVLAEQAERVKEREPMATIRRVDVSGRSQFLDTVPLSQVNEDWLADTYGGGKYQVMQRGMTASGKWGYVGHDTLEIDESLPFKGSIRKQKEEREASRGFGIEDGAASLHAADGRMLGGGGSRMDSIIEGGIIGLMRKSEESYAHALTMQLQLMQESRQASQAQMTMMMKMVETMGSGGRSSPLIEAIIAAAAPAIPELLKSVLGRKDSTAEMLLLMEKMQPKGEAAKLDDTLEMLRKLREVASDVTGDAEPASPMLRVMEKLAEFLPVLVARQQGAPTPSAPAPASGPVLGEPGQRSALPDGSGVPMIEGPEDVWRLIGEQMPLIRSFAAMGRDTRRVAAMAVEFASAPQRALMMEVLGSDEFTKQFFERFPQMETYRRWTESFIEELRIELFGEGDDEEEGDGEGSPTDGGAK